jgi:hypothetical protein
MADLLEDLRAGKVHRAKTESPNAYKGTNLLEDLRAGKVHRAETGKQQGSFNGDLLNDLRAGKVQRASTNGSASSNTYTPGTESKPSEAKNVKTSKNKIYKKEAKPTAPKPEYEDRDKLFIDEINLDHMLKNKDDFTEEQIEQAKAAEKRKKEKAEFEKRMRN